MECKKYNEDNMLKNGLTALFGGLLMLSAFTLKADLPESDFALFGGYKRANIKTPLNSESETDGFLGNYPVHLSKVRIWQIGLNARYAFPDFFAGCGCDSAWLKQFYLRGSVAIGKVNGGRIKNNAVIPGSDQVSYEGNIKKGYSRDYDIALGWLYPWCDNFGIGPVVGYNYDKIKAKAGSIELDDVDVPDLDHVRYVSRFKGGYVGVDIAYYACDWKLYAGYEYHMPVWSGAWKLPGFDNDNGYSDHRTGGHGHGNVFYVDGRYQFCGCWEIGLLYRYENYRSGKGSANPRCCSACTGNPEDIQNKIHTKYHAWSLNLELAASF